MKSCSSKSFVSHRLIILSVLLILSASLIPLRSYAQKIYQCKDENGRTLTSDRPIPECDKVPMKELGRDGLYRREIAAPLTARRDAALLEVYRNEQDIEQARQRKLKQLDTDLALSKGRANQNTRELQMLQKEVAGYGTRPAPLDIQRRITEIQSAIKAEATLQTELQGHIAKTNSKFDQDLQRFREITSSQLPK